MAQPCDRSAPYYTSAAPLVPSEAPLDALANAALGCRACHLWRCGTQTVFGEGPSDARVVMIGEQPGDREDLAGRPFVGPAGRLLDDCLVEAGIERSQVYLTNAVKHFKWIPKGSRRIHQKPNRLEVNACRPWLDAELRIIEPDVVVMLGAVAAQALLGSGFKVTVSRGKPIAMGGRMVGLATVHPSSVLRAPDELKRAEARGRLVADLKVVAGLLSHQRAA